ncbi:hypothetical protein FHW75_005114 [Pseudomonas sp. OG7]|jgi:hypothetical protein|nr:hypothetical protein [Pseudomonas sp. OG7]
MNAALTLSDHLPALRGNHPRLTPEELIRSKTSRPEISRVSSKRLSACENAKMRLPEGVIPARVFGENRRSSNTDQVMPCAGNAAPNTASIPNPQALATPNLGYATITDCNYVDSFTAFLLVA